jgi:hypothetical protein
MSNIDPYNSVKSMTEKVVVSYYLAQIKKYPNKIIPDNETNKLITDKLYNSKFQDKIKNIVIRNIQQSTNKYSDELLNECYNEYISKINELDTMIHVEIYNHQESIKESVKAGYKHQ